MSDDLISRKEALERLQLLKNSIRQKPCKLKFGK